MSSAHTTQDVQTTVEAARTVNGFIVEVGGWAAEANFEI
jgi:hypothetical protein